MEPVDAGVKEKMPKIDENHTSPKIVVGAPCDGHSGIRGELNKCKKKQDKWIHSL